MSEELLEHMRIMTIQRHILEAQQYHPEATGVLTGLLYDIALAGKVISSKTNRAGLAEILGRTNTINVQGEVVQKLDYLADLVMYRLNDHTGRLAAMGSEEHPDMLTIPDRFPSGKYILLYDPLDGSSNIDFNIPIGTIFAIYRRKSESGPVCLSDCLQKARNLVAAGYIVYGSSTMLVYSAGHGVNGFTLDPTVGEFILSHPNIRIPETPKYFSANVGYQINWSKGVGCFTDYLQGRDNGYKGLSLRYVGSLVADFHRNLLAGGVFYYPADVTNPKGAHGKLRLMYEAGPLAFLAEQAGGRGSDGCQNILDIQPESLHQRTPLFIGNRDLVEKAEQYIQEYDSN